MLIQGKNDDKYSSKTFDSYLNQTKEYPHFLSNPSVSIPLISKDNISKLIVHDFCVLQSLSMSNAHAII